MTRPIMDALREQQRREVARKAREAIGTDPALDATRKFAAAIREANLNAARAGISLAAVVTTQPRIAFVETAPVRLTMTEKIFRAVAEEFDCGKSEIRSACKSKRLVEARNAAVRAFQMFTPMSSPQIGAKIHRDHTTVLHAARRVKEMIERDEAYAARIERVVGRIRAMEVLEHAARNTTSSGNTGGLAAIGDSQTVRPLPGDDRRNDQLGSGQDGGLGG